MLRDLDKKDTLLAFVVALILSYVRKPCLCDAVVFSACFVLVFLTVKQLLGI
jgi:hypothetical protein